jgi:hypothetical protein
LIKELSTELHCVISSFRREVEENSWILDALKMGPMGWPETSVKNLYHYWLRNNPEKGEFSKLHCFVIPLLTQVECYHLGVAKVSISKTN